MTIKTFAPTNAPKRLKIVKATNRKVTGFTLTELLVVLAAVAILAATLLPGLAATKLKELSTQCVDNLRQLTAAATVYQTENVNIAYGTDLHRLWFVPLTTLQNAAAIHLSCPLAANPRPGTGQTQGTANNSWTWPVYINPNNPGLGTVNTNGSYGFNGWLYGYNSFIPLNTGISDAARFFGSSAAVTQPSRTPEFMDALWPDLWPYQGGAPDSTRNWFPYDENGMAGNNLQYNGMGRCCIERHGEKPPLTSPVTLSDTVRPFPGGINVSFVDGHVAYTKLDDLWLLYWNRNVVPHSRP